MDGNAVHWFQYWRRNAKNPSWEEFIVALLRRYGGVRCGTVYERLAALRQKGGVEEYVQEFELWVAQATSTSEDQLLGYFLVGLRQNIRSKILPHDPRELVRAMELACDIDIPSKDHIKIEPKATKIS